MTENSRHLQRDNPAGWLPRLAHDLVDRPRLYDRLDLLAPLTVVRGPAGAGKTTAVVAWASRRRGTPDVRWLSLDGRTDPDRFWRECWSALTDVRDGSTAGPPDLVRAARALTRPTVLVVDDFDHADPSVDEDLQRVLRSCPSLHVVACLRRRRRLETGRWAPPNRVVVSGSELSLTADEVADLASRTGARLSADQLAEIHRATAGWIAPTKVALSAVNEPAVSNGAAGPGREGHRHADRRARYAVAEAALYVWRIATADGERSVPRGLLAPCSIVTEFTAGLAAALTEDTGIASLLEDAEAYGLVEPRTMAGEQGYRIVPLLRESLSREYETTAPDEYLAAQARAAQWYRDNGMPQRAVVHAAEARRWDLVGDIVDANWTRLITLHPYELRQGMREFPEDIAAGRPRLRAARQVALAVPGSRGPVLAVYQPGSSALRQLGRSGSVRDAIAVGTAQAMALRTAGEFSAATQLLDQLDTVLQGVPHDTGTQIANVLPLLRLQWGLCRLLAGSTWRATREFTHAYHGAGMSGVDTAARYAAVGLALISAINGDLRHATRWLEREQRHCAEDWTLGEFVKTWSEAARCLVAVECHDADGLRSPVTGECAPVNELWSFTAYAAAQRALALGEPFAVLPRIHSAMQAAAEDLRELGMAGVLIASAMTELLLALGQGNRARAAAWGVDTWHPLVEVSRARVDLLAGNLEAVRARATDVVWRPETDYRSRLDMLLLKAVSSARLGDESVMLTAAGQALSVADSTGAVRPFAAVPRGDLERVLARLPDGRRVLERLDRAGVREMFPETVEFVELTERERVVLEQLTQTPSVERIAQQLVVSVNTVKSQLRSLYRKLGAGSRQQAIKEAGRHGLLESGKSTG